MPLLDIRRCALSALTLILILAPAARAQDGSGSGLSREERIRIDKNAARQIPLLLQQFEATGGATREDTRLVYEVLLGDLTFTDFFEIKEVPTPGAGDSLRAGGAYALVRGVMRIEGGDLVLQGFLEALPGRSAIFSREYRTRPEWYREAAHRFADDIVAHLTDYKGIARTKIAFASNRSGNKEIYIIDYDGHGLRQVTKNGSINMSPAWSPDGARLAYVSYKNGSADIFLIELATGKETLLAGGAGVQTAPAFSPDGSRILYSQSGGGESEIYVVPAAGGRPSRVTRMGGINMSPSWAPDGRRMVFTSDRTGNPHLYVGDVDGGTPRRVTIDGKWNDVSDWSPDGETIIYSSRQDGTFGLSTVEPVGSGRELRRTYGSWNDQDPSWAPNSRHVVFTSTRSGGRGVYVLDSESGRIRPVLQDGNSSFGVAWGPVPPR